MKLTINGKAYIRFQIVTLDVWGNARIGYYVNDFDQTGEYVTLPEGYGDMDVIKALKGANVIKRGCRYTSFHIDHYDIGMSIAYGAACCPMLNLIEG